MKPKIKQYLEVFILAVAIIVFYKMFDGLDSFLRWIKLLMGIMLPFIVGGILAYFLYPLCKGVEKYITKTNNPKLIQHQLAIGVFVTYFSFLLLLIIILTYLIPLTIHHIMDFLNKAPQFLEQFNYFIDTSIKNEKILNMINPILDQIQFSAGNMINFDLFKYAQGAISTASTIFSWIMGLVVCPYILIERRNLRRIFDQVASLFFPSDKIAFVHQYLYKIHKIFLSFIYGKAIDSFIIGIIAFIFFSLMKMKFAFVLGLIIMVTNMIPYFGPFIGGIPIVAITLVVSSPMQAFWVGLFIFALQQFDGLILGPAILGDSVGISPFWIIFAITLFGGLWGVVGMFVGVPLIAVFRMILNDFLVYKKEGKINND